MCVYSLLRKKKRGFSGHRLPRFVTHVSSSKKKSQQLGVSRGYPLQMCRRWQPFQTCAFTNTSRDGEWDGVFFFMYVWGWEALSELEMPTGSFHFTQNHQLHPTSTTILVCCFSAAVAQPAGEERRLFVVSQPERWEGFSTAYITCLFSFNAGRALTITLDGYQ